ncbi:RidA family protein (plasmid) [Erwinia pyri]|uniref:RidA family protein n=1 Tax=Erwinia pyri TaxID=3062598 RepID=A0AA50DNJ0_9GAMM|nr:RidA family protein [Erwinia sp. DE2]WLS81085.1 RidA family protein [Erwinia sp. DE2]
MTLVSGSKLSPLGDHYSYGVVAGQLLFVSGQLPFLPETGQFPQGLEAQTCRSMQNLSTVLAQEEATLEQLVNVPIHIVDVADWPSVNRVYSEVMIIHRPARTIIPCGALIEISGGALIEISGKAALNQSEQGYCT